MNDGQYFQIRAVEEMEAAKQSSHPNVRRVHLQLAEEYAGRARACEAAKRRSSFQLVSAA